MGWRRRVWGVRGRLEPRRVADGWRRRREAGGGAVWACWAGGGVEGVAGCLLINSCNFFPFFFF